MCMHAHNIIQTHVHTLTYTHYTHTHTHTHTPRTHTYTRMYSSHTVPSGYILTKQELQVLGALLATYSEERLKDIQLSIQEEKEIRDISREEVEKSLRQSGLASIADGLKDNIEKGIAGDDTQLFISAYWLAMMLIMLV